MGWLSDLIVGALDGGSGSKNNGDDDYRVEEEERRQEELTKNAEAADSRSSKGERTIVIHIDENGRQTRRD